MDSLFCTFTITPENVKPKEAASMVAAESSTGTWTELTTLTARSSKLAANVRSMRRSGKAYSARIEYPPELFEKGNMPQILSSVAGNVFGMKGFLLRLDDIEFPRGLARSFPGPRHGIRGIRRELKVKRPLVGTIVKPKLGLTSSQHSRVAYEAWAGGCDIVKDDENLSSQSFNSFSRRVSMTLKAKRRAEEETGERKVYLCNVTAETGEMMRRARSLERQNSGFLMVDILTCGWSSVQTLRQTPLIMHGHRAGHAAFTRNPGHGISMRVIAKVARLVGIDELHIGTSGIGKMEDEGDRAAANALKEPLHKIRQAMPVASGGLHPGLVPEVISAYGKDVIIQMGGGIHGHPGGTAAGARAARQAVDAVLEGVPLKKYAKGRELGEALEHWKG